MKDSIQHMRVYGQSDYSLIRDVWNEVMYKITKNPKYLYRMCVLEDVSAPIEGKE